MGLLIFDELRTLLTGRFTVDVLRERLGLLEDMMRLKDERIRVLEQELAQQQSQPQTQQSDQNLAQPVPQRRSPEEEQILGHLASYSNLSSSDIATDTRLSPAKATAYLHILEEQGLVQGILSLELRERVWLLTTSGHRYLLQFSLLS